MTRSTRKRRGVMLAASAAIIIAAATPALAAAQATESAADVPRLAEDARGRATLLEPTFYRLAELPGFQDGGLHAEADRIKVYWHGPLGDEATRLIGESEARGVPVDVIRVDRSLDELRVMAGTLGRALEAAGFSISGYVIGNPFDEIQIASPELTHDRAARAVASAIAADVLPADMTATFATEIEKIETLVGQGSASWGSRARVRGEAGLRPSQD